jgi:hypothetical protein
MKKILTALGLLIGMFARSQVISYPNPGLFGSGMHRFVTDSTLYYPTGCGVPSGTASLNSSGFTGFGQKLKMSAFYYDSCGHKLWVFDPSSSTWAGFSSGVIDTTSLSNRINLKMGYADTTLMLAPYSRINQTVANLGGIPGFLEDVAAARPSVGSVATGVLFLAVDTKLLYRNNGASWDLIAGGGGGGAGSNLNYVPGATSGSITNDNGTGATLPVVTSSQAGLADTAMKRLSDSIHNRQILTTIYFRQGLAAYGPGFDSVRLGGPGFTFADTIATNGNPFLLTGLPGKTPGAGDSMMIEDANKNIKLAAILGGSSGISFDNMAAINSTAAVTGQTISVRGFYAIGDGGGGDFYYVAGSSATVVPGMVISVTGGRLFRLWDQKHLNYLWFGGIGDGSTDNTAIKQAAVNFQPGTELYIPTPAVKYIQRNNVYYNTSNVHVLGQDKYATIFDQPIGNSYVGGARWRGMDFIANIGTNKGVSNVTIENISYLNHDTVTTLQGLHNIQPACITIFMDSAFSGVTGMVDSNINIKNCVISAPVGQEAGIVALAFRSNFGGTLKFFNVTGCDFNNVAGCAAEVLNTNTRFDNHESDITFAHNKFNYCGQLYPANGFAISFGGYATRILAEDNHIHHQAGIGIEFGGNSYSTMRDNTVDSSDATIASGLECAPWCANNSNGNGGGPGVGNSILSNKDLDSTYIAPYYLNQEKATVSGNQFKQVNACNCGSWDFQIGSVKNSSFSDEKWSIVPSGSVSTVGGVNIFNYASLGVSSGNVFSNININVSSGFKSVISLLNSSSGNLFSNITVRNHPTPIIFNDGTSTNNYASGIDSLTGNTWTYGTPTAVSPSSLLALNPDSSRVQIAFDGNTAHFLNGAGGLTTPAGGGGALPAGVAPNFLQQIDNTPTYAFVDPRALDTVYIVADGQSNNGGGSEDLVLDSISDPRVQIWDYNSASPNKWKVAHIGQSPFNTTSPVQLSPTAWFYFARNIAQRTGKFVKLVTHFINASSITGWYATTVRQPGMDSMVNRIIASGIPRIDYHIWQQGESDPAMPPATWTNGYDSVRFCIRRLAACLPTTKFAIVGMPDTLSGAAGGFQGQEPTMMAYGYGLDPWVCFVSLHIFPGADTVHVNSGSGNHIHLSANGYKKEADRLLTAFGSIPMRDFERGNAGGVSGTSISPNYIFNVHSDGAGGSSFGISDENTNTAGFSGYRLKNGTNVAALHLSNTGTFLGTNTFALGTEFNGDVVLYRNFSVYATLTSAAGFQVTPVLTALNNIVIKNVTSSATPNMQVIGDGSNSMVWQLNNSAASTNPNSSTMYNEGGYKWKVISTGMQFFAGATAPAANPQNVVEIDGSFGMQVDSGTVTTTLGVNHQTYFMKPTVSDTVFIPTSATAFGRRYVVFNTGASNTVTLVPFTSQYLNRATTPIVIPAGSRADIIMDGVAGSYVTIASATSGGGTPTFQQVLTAGSTMTGTNAVALAGNLFSLTGGNVGIGATAASSAQLKLGLNTTAISSVNITPSSAVNVTSPNDGDLWYNGTNLNFRHGGTTTDLIVGTGGGGGTQTLQQVLTTGSTMTGANAVLLGGNLFSFTGGNMGFGGTAVSTSQALFGANTTGISSFNIAPSSAVNVTSPNDGDMWYNGTNLNFRHGGTTTDVLAAGGGGTPGGSTTQLQYNNGGAFGGTAGVVWDAANSGLKLNSNSLGTTLAFAKGMYLQNSTAAAAGAQQISPILTLEGQGWKTTATAASQAVGFTLHVLPVQGTTNPTSILNFNSQINGTQFTAMQLTSLGGLTGFGGGAGGNFGLTSGSGLGMIIYPASGSLNLGQNVSRSSEMISFNNGGGAQHFCNWWNAGGTQTMEFNDGGALGIGVTPAATPLYTLGIKAGTSAISQINLAAGTKTTSMVAGDLTYATGHLWFHDAADFDILNPTYTTQSQGDNSTKPATTAYADAHLPASVASNNLAGQTAANNSIIVYNTPAADHTFQINAYCTITALVTDVLICNVTYTDESNTARTYTFFPQGTSTGNMTSTGTYAFSTIAPRCKASTTITLTTSLVTGTGSITYNVGGTVVEVN